MLMSPFPCLHDTWMTPHKQHGGMLCFSSVVYDFTLEYLATSGFHWVELFTSMTLRNGYGDEKMSPEQSNDIGLSSKWVNVQFCQDYPFKLIWQIRRNWPFFVCFAVLMYQQWHRVYRCSCSLLLCYPKNQYRNNQNKTRSTRGLPRVQTLPVSRCCAMLAR